MRANIRNADCGLRIADWETGGPSLTVGGVRDPDAMNRAPTGSGAVNGVPTAPGAMNRAATGSGAVNGVPSAPDAMNRPPSAMSVGEISPALVREWGPLLKPTGLGLLLALHSFEETTGGHPFFGWAHCTQTALAAYLDTSQDTIARYSQLLLICGLVQVEEVEIPRGKQKLYRVARGLPLPSVGLLEYLLFDADGWTRKHTGWLTAPLVPLGAATELTRLTGILGRAYGVTRDRAGVATLVAGARLTAAGSYRGRPAVARQRAFDCGLRIADCGIRPGDGRLDPAECGMRNAECGIGPGADRPNPPTPFPIEEGGVAAVESAASGGVAAVGTHLGELAARAEVSPHTNPLPPGEFAAPSTRRGRVTPRSTDMESAASGGVGTAFAPQRKAGLANKRENALLPAGSDSAGSGAVIGAGQGLAIEVGQESAGRGVGMAGSPQGAESGRSAGRGVGGGAALVGGLDLGRESAGGGSVVGQESAGGGVAAPNVNVDRESVKTEMITNVNGAGTAGTALSAAELGALLDWGTAALADEGSREWHRQCVVDYGADLYEWAIQATVVAQGKGRVSRPGAYFTSLLRRRGRALTDTSTTKEHTETRRTATSAKEREETRRGDDLSAQARDEAKMDASAKEREGVRRDLAGLGDALGGVPGVEDGALVTGAPTAATGRVWQAALIHLRVGVAAEVYGRVLRYAVLLRLDVAAGEAVLGVPAAYMRDAIQGELAPAIGAALGLVCGAVVRVTAVVR